MQIEGLEIQNYTKAHAEETSKISRTLFTGRFHCPGLPLHEKMLRQVSITKVMRHDEHGNKEWGNTKTTFTVIGLDTTFFTLKGLITYYNQPNQFKPMQRAGHHIKVSANGEVIVNGGERRIYIVGGNKEVELGGKLHSVARLVAIAWHGQPKNPAYVVQFKDGDQKNTHYTNLYWGSYKKGRPVKLTDRQRTRIRSLHRNGETFKGLARQFGVSARTIKRVVENPNK